MEEDLGSKESFVANVDGEWLLGDGVDALILFDPFVNLAVVLVEFLHDVRTHVRELLLWEEGERGGGGVG